MLQPIICPPQAGAQDSSNNKDDPCLNIIDNLDQYCPCLRGQVNQNREAIRSLAQDNEDRSNDPESHVDSLGAVSRAHNEKKINDLGKANEALEGKFAAKDCYSVIVGKKSQMLAQQAAPASDGDSSSGTSDAGSVSPDVGNSPPPPATPPDVSPGKKKSGPGGSSQF